MRTRTVLVLGLLLTAGCGPGEQETPNVASVQGATPSVSVSASVDPDAPLKHAQCMREHGMTWFPDPPGAGQPMAIQIPETVKKEDFDAAMQECRKFAPGGGIDQGGPNAEDLEKLRQMAKCMRENGVPDYPDPAADGNLSLDEDLSVKPGDPIFDKAEKSCSQFMPGGAKRVSGGQATAGN